MGDSHNLGKCQILRGPFAAKLTRNETTAWKLAYVLRGWANPSLLQTYEAERRAYALDLIYFDREISQSLEGGPAAEYQRLVNKIVATIQRTHWAADCSTSRTCSPGTLISLCGLELILMLV